MHRWSYLKEDPSTTLSKIETIDPGKLEVLNLALAYYKLGEYANPLRIESFFSLYDSIASGTCLIKTLVKTSKQSEVKNK